MRDLSPVIHEVAVYRAVDIACVMGANEGDALSFAADLVLGDVYALAEGAVVAPLALKIDPKGRLQVAGRAVHLDSTLSFMCPQGRQVEVIVLVEVDQAGDAVQTHVMPLSPMRSKVDYTLMRLDPGDAAATFARLACAQFARGTRIALASGEEKAVEALRAGDRVLTRDHGAQVLRWVGQATLRAYGAFAPVRIAAGALNNHRDLWVSPGHRLFVFQRRDVLAAGRQDVLVRAGDLVNGVTVTRSPQPFVDYVQLLFDRHEVVFAEGIGAETVVLNGRTARAVPAKVAKQTQGGGSRLAGLDVRAADLAGDPVALLRGASWG